MKGETINKDNSPRSYLQWLRNQSDLFVEYKPPDKEQILEKQRPFGLKVLHEIAAHPWKYKECIVLLENDFIVIYDAYPKSIVHLLIIPRDTTITCAGALNRNLDYSLIDRITVAAVWLIEKCSVFYPALTFNVGIHALPSLSPLHFHVVSQDLTGSGMKKYGHWISFTTEFLVPLSQIRVALGLPAQVPDIQPNVEIEVSNKLESSDQIIQDNEETKYNRRILNYKDDWHELILQKPQRYWSSLLNDDLYCNRAGCHVMKKSIDDINHHIRHECKGLYKPTSM